MFRVTLSLIFLNREETCQPSEIGLLFVKFLRAPFLQNTSGRRFLLFSGVYPSTLPDLSFGRQE